MESREQPGEGEELREEDVTRGDKLDDRIAEGDDLPGDDDEKT